MHEEMTVQAVTVGYIDDPVPYEIPRVRSGKKLHAQWTVLERGAARCSSPSFFEPRR